MCIDKLLNIQQFKYKIKISHIVLSKHMLNFNQQVLLWKMFKVKKIKNNQIINELLFLSKNYMKLIKNYLRINIV